MRFGIRFVFVTASDDESCVHASRRRSITVGLQKQFPATNLCCVRGAWPSIWKRNSLLKSFDNGYGRHGGFEARAIFDPSVHLERLFGPERQANGIRDA